MTQLVWNSVGQRLYETGVDRGVLYVGEDPGVPWNGLVSVTQKSSGGDPTPHYVDGIKFLNYSAVEEAEFTLSAFFSPEEFDVCEGLAELSPGFSAHNQARKEFGLSYRTRIGNDLQGTAYGYKIHLVYNALASPSDVTYETESDSLDLQTLSWDLTTRPIVLDGLRVGAHFEFDSTKMSEANINFFERILYGGDLETPRLPTIEEVSDIYLQTYGIALYGTTTYP